MSDQCMVCGAASRLLHLPGLGDITGSYVLLHTCYYRVWGLCGPQHVPDSHVASIVASNIGFYYGFYCGFQYWFRLWLLLWLPILISIMASSVASIVPATLASIVAAIKASTMTRMVFHCGFYFDF